MSRLKELRERAVFSQQALAEKAGVARHTISNIETGRVKPRPSIVRRLAGALGCEPSEILEPAPTE